MSNNIFDILVKYCANEQNDVMILKSAGYQKGRFHPENIFLPYPVHPFPRFLHLYITGMLLLLFCAPHPSDMLFVRPSKSR